MIAKGHDFPRVTLVGVISADVGLGLADFRAAERTFQLLTQVAGRAGRGEIRGEAIVQTLFPNHYSIQHACRQDYAGVLRGGAELPPGDAVSAGGGARQRRGEGTNARTARQHDAGELVQALRTNGAPYRVLGPAPAPLSRLKGEHRAQFFMKGTHRATHAPGAARRARHPAGDQAADDRRCRSDECAVSGDQGSGISGSRGLKAPSGSWADPGSA